LTSDSCNVFLLKIPAWKVLNSANLFRIYKRKHTRTHTRGVSLL
jgi:hypothetical protein